jgi:hypothetical protein
MIKKEVDLMRTMALEGRRMFLLKKVFFPWKIISAKKKKLSFLYKNYM